MSMTTAQKKALADTLETLADELEIDAAVAHLYGKNCLTDSDIEHIERVSSNEEVNKVKAFLEMLKKRGKHSFEAFVAYLKESRGQGHLAEELLENLRDAESNASEDKVKDQWMTYENNFHNFKCAYQRFHDYARMPDKINILLIGKTGSGKSATGNTILGSRGFKEGHGSQSETKTIQMYQVKMEKIKITVIDTPGLFDTDKNVKNEDILLEISKTMIHFMEGIHLFLLVLGSTKFTEEEQKTVNEIQKVLGTTIYKNTMLVLTKAKSNFGDGRESLQEYIRNERSQGGAFASLLEQIGNRVIAVENFFDDESMKTVHRERLFCSFAQVLHENHGRVYSNRAFQTAKTKVEQQKKNRNERIAKFNENSEMERLLRFYLNETYLPKLSLRQLDALQSTLENNVDEIMRSCGLQLLQHITEEDVKQYFTKFISEDKILIVMVKDMKMQQKKQQEDSKREKDQLTMEEIVLYHVSRYLKELSRDKLEDLIKKREIGQPVMKRIDDDLKLKGLKFESKGIQKYVKETFFENPTEIRQNIKDKKVQEKLCAKQRQLKLEEQRTKVIRNLMVKFPILVEKENDKCLRQLRNDLEEEQRWEARLKPLISKLVKDLMGDFDINIAEITHLFVKENLNFLRSVLRTTVEKREQQKLAKEKEMLQNLRKSAFREISDIIDHNLRKFLTGRTKSDLKNIEREIMEKKVPREIFEEVKKYLTKEQQNALSSQEIEREILIQIGEQQALINEIKEEAKCFAGSTTIRIKRCGISKISQVKLNDEILVYDENGYVFYDKVYLISHANETEIVTYVRLQTSSGKELCISPGHLLPVSSLCGTIAARDVSLGDVIFTLQDGVMMPVKVTSITYELCRGAYCPMTMHGTIVVNDVAASCYTTFFPAPLAHALLSPLRGLFRFTPLPLFNKLLPHDAEEGMPVLLLKCRSMIIMWRSFVEKYTSWKTNE